MPGVHSANTLTGRECHNPEIQLEEDQRAERQHPRRNETRHRTHSASVSGVELFADDLPSATSSYPPSCFFTQLRC